MGQFSPLPAFIRCIFHSANRELKNITNFNIGRKITDIQNELNQWSKRDLTPFGKVTVIKTLIISKIVHLLLSLPSPSCKLIKDINQMLYSFLWDGKPDKMRRSLAKQSMVDGGICMLDFDLFDKSLKLTWIRRLLREEKRWKDIVLEKYPQILDIT